MNSTKPNIFNKDQDYFYDHLEDNFMESELMKSISTLSIENYEEKVKEIEVGSLIAVDYEPFFDWFKKYSNVLKYINPLVELKIKNGDNITPSFESMKLSHELFMYFYSELRTWTCTKGHPIAVAAPKKEKVNTNDYVNKYIAKVNKSNPSG